MKKNANQHRRTEDLKDINYVIALKPELKIQYNVASIKTSQNYHQNDLAQSTKYKINMKAYLKRKIVLLLFLIYIYIYKNKSWYMSLVQFFA